MKHISIGTKRVARVEENTAADSIELSAAQIDGSTTSRRPPASGTTKATWPSSTADHGTAVPDTGDTHA